MSKAKPANGSENTILAAIRAAGPAGTYTQALTERLGCSKSTVWNAVLRLSRAMPPVIVKRDRGIYVAVEHAGSAPEPVAIDIDGISLEVDHHEVGELPAESHAAQMAQIGYALPPVAPARYAVVFPSDFHTSVDAAVAQAVRDYGYASLSEVVVIVCTPLGRIEMRPVLVPEAA